MGRHRSVRYFPGAQLSPSFFRPLLAKALERLELEVTEVTVLETDPDASIVSVVAARGLGHKLVGVIPLRIGYSTAVGPDSIDGVAKFQAPDAVELIEARRVARLSVAW